MLCRIIQKVHQTIGGQQGPDNPVLQLVKYICKVGTMVTSMPFYEFSPHFS